MSLSSWALRWGRYQLVVDVGVVDGCLSRRDVVVETEVALYTYGNFDIACDLV